MSNIKFYEEQLREAWFRHFAEFLAEIPGLFDCLKDEDEPPMIAKLKQCLMESWDFNN